MADAKALADISSEQTSAASGDLAFIESGGVAAKITYANLMDNNYTYAATMTVTGTINLGGGTLTLADDQIGGAKVAIATDTTRGTLEIATQAEAEAGASDALAMTPLGVTNYTAQFGRVIAIAEVDADGGTPAFVFSEGLSATITDNGTGDYTFAFDSAEPDTEYEVLPTPSGAQNRDFIRRANKTTAGFDIIVSDVNGVARDRDGIGFVVVRFDA